MEIHRGAVSGGHRADARPRGDRLAMDPSSATWRTRSGIRALAPCPPKHAVRGMQYSIVRMKRRDFLKDVAVGPVGRATAGTAAPIQSRQTSESFGEKRVRMHVGSRSRETSEEAISYLMRCSVYHYDPGMPPIIPGGLGPRGLYCLGEEGRETWHCHGCLPSAIELGRNRSDRRS